MQRVVLAIRASLVATVALGLFSVVSCSGDDAEEEKCDASKMNCGGSGGSEKPPEPIECGSETCQPVNLIGNLPPVPACCTEDTKCGLDSSLLNDYGAVFEETCQALHQPGEKDDECPQSAPLMHEALSTPIRLDGCCRAETGRCGYMLDAVIPGLIVLNLGCVDSTPFLEGGTAEPCTPAGAGGAGGAGG